MIQELISKKDDYKLEKIGKLHIKLKTQLVTLVGTHLGNQAKTNQGPDLFQVMHHQLYF